MCEQSRHHFTLLHPCYFLSPPYFLGVAFADSIAGGISTTVAVFCHELPHELGTLCVRKGGNSLAKYAILLTWYKLKRDAVWTVMFAFGER